MTVSFLLCGFGDHWLSSRDETLQLAIEHCRHELARAAAPSIGWLTCVPFLSSRALLMGAKCATRQCLNRLLLLLSFGRAASGCSPICRSFGLGEQLSGALGASLPSCTSSLQHNSYIVLSSFQSGQSCSKVIQLAQWVLPTARVGFVLRTAVGTFALESVQHDVAHSACLGFVQQLNYCQCLG